MPACGPAIAHACSYCSNHVLARRARRRTHCRRRRQRAPGVTLSTACSTGNGARLAHLPADDLAQVRGTARAPSRACSSDTFATVSGTTSATRAAARRRVAPSTRATTCDDRRDVGHVEAGERRHDGARRQRLDGVRRRRRACRRATSTRAAATWVAIDFDGDVWRRGRREQVEQAHSTNVTLLISRSVVSPSHHPFDRRLAQQPHALLLARRASPRRSAACRE